MIKAVIADLAFAFPVGKACGLHMKDQSVVSLINLHRAKVRARSHHGLTILFRVPRALSLLAKGGRPALNICML
jgi:hypothetical protein